MTTQPTERSTDEEKPKRLYFKTYLQLIRNSVGTEMFRNFYVQIADGTEMDAMSDGSNSCAFYVTSVLTIFGRLSGIHGTVQSTLADLERSGWQQVQADAMQAGDVIVWEAVEIEGREYRHIGFYLGGGRAVSTSQTEKKVVEHDARFDSARAIEHVFRCDRWE